jgi:hypothetical protein
MIKKVVHINLNVGSGIEYCGDIFSSWLRERQDIEFFEIKEQDHHFYMSDILVKIKPDIIIVNEFEDRSILCSSYYKKYNPEVKIIFLLHSWKSISVGMEENPSNEEVLSFLFLRQCNAILSLNCMPLSAKTYNLNIERMYFPVDSNIYKITKNWSDREKDFLYLGTLGTPKFSEKFLDLIKDSDVFVDCYGYIPDRVSELYKKKLLENENIRYHGVAKQEEVAKIFNEYKYMVIPHDGYEIFNISILQSILCGTIPLISNDRESLCFDSSWLNWANGFIFECNKEEELINNMLILKDKPFETGDEISKKISNEAMKKYSYFELKRKFNKILEDVGGI